MSHRSVFLLAALGVVLSATLFAAAFLPLPKQQGGGGEYLFPKTGGEVTLISRVGGGKSTFLRGDMGKETSLLQIPALPLPIGWGVPVGDFFTKDSSVVSRGSRIKVPQSVPIPSASLLLSRKMSEEEIFNTVWPPVYRDALRSLEALVTQNWATLAENGVEDVNALVHASTTSALKSDAAIQQSIIKIADGAYRNGWISREEHKNFVRGAKEVLPDLIETEKEELRRSGAQGKLLPKNQRFSQSQNTKARMRDFFSGFTYVFGLVEPAYAEWVRSAECYKDDDPDSKAEGFNGATFCCNCGIEFTGKKCTPQFEQDCGEQDQTCKTNGVCGYTPLGCLNLICKQSENAIWDSQTGICGCSGAGGGGGG